jgi:hypothetical protein
VIDPTYLPFPAEVLLDHLTPDADKARHLRSYTKSADAYHCFQRDNSDRRGLPISRLKKSCQIEKGRIREFSGSIPGRDQALHSGSRSPS